jgi:hypothetical protein
MVSCSHRMRGLAPISINRAAAGTVWVPPLRLSLGVNLSSRPVPCPPTASVCSRTEILGMAPGPARPEPRPSRRFYRDLLGLAIYREFGPPDEPGLVFFPGQGLLEVSGHAAGPPARCGRTALVAVGLVQPHSRDLSTSTSQPGEDGSKPCSTSQRTASRLRNDHHARITSRSTSVP